MRRRLQLLTALLMTLGLTACGGGGGDQAPVAKAGEDVTARAGEVVAFDASGSSDTDGSISSYKWTEGATLLSSSASFSTSDFSVGLHTVTLTVTDNENATATDTVIVTILSQNAIADCIETNSDLGYAKADIYTNTPVKGMTSDTKIRVWHLSNGDKKICVTQGSAQKQ